MIESIYMYIDDSTDINNNKKQSCNEKQFESNKNRENNKHQRNWNLYNHTQCYEKSYFMEILSNLCSLIDTSNCNFSNPNKNCNNNGRPPLPLNEMIFLIVLKVYTQQPSRKFYEEMRRAYSLNYLTQLPHFNSVNNYMGEENLKHILENLIVESSSPLKDIENKFAIDTSGFSTNEFERWQYTKYENKIPKKRWLKAHINVGTKTKIIVASKVTNSNVNDSVLFKRLISTTNKNFAIENQLADKAYLSRNNIRIAGNYGAYPFIPPKTNTTVKTDDSPLWKSMIYCFYYHTDYFNEHYHQRSNVESAFSMLKRNFGPSLRSKNETSLINELLCKLLSHNISVLINEMYILNLDIDFTEAKMIYPTDKPTSVPTTLDNFGITNESQLAEI